VTAPLSNMGKLGKGGMRPDSALPHDCLVFSGIPGQSGAKIMDGANFLRRAATAILWRLIAVGILGLAASGEAQTALEVFSNQANALLQAEFGFGVTNIPVWTITNPSVQYTAAVHYVLQAAADDYDATNSSTDFPSVFRPVFAAQSNGLWIAGYTNVTGDFDAQMALGFKQPTDPTTGPNDNVWGVPWVVGAKGHPPNFNEYSYATAFNITRRILVTRRDTNMPPQFTNQSYEMSVSNMFGAEAWNSYSATFSNVAMIASNQVSILFTNNYNWGTKFTFGTGTNLTINSWPGSSNADHLPSPGFIVPLLTTVVPLADSYWSDSLGQFLAASNSPPFSANDEQQVAWPAHDWTLQITNQLMYALVETSTGTNRVLDFVNLAGFGSALDVNQVLTNFIPIEGSEPSSMSLVWNTDRATDDPLTSPMSSGVQAQLRIATGKLSVSDWPVTTETAYRIQDFNTFLSGRGPVLASQTPFTPSATVLQTCTWQAATPWVHYTVEDLDNWTMPTTNIVIAPIEIPGYSQVNLRSQLSNSIATIGRVNSAYQPVTVSDMDFGLAGGDFSLSFAGFTNMPFAVWASGDLVNWAPAGTALQPSPGQFQFNDPAAAKSPARFYQLRLP